MQHRPYATKKTSIRWPGLLAAGLLLICQAAIAAEPDGSKVLARVNGTAITEAEVTESLAGELLKLDMQRHEVISNGVTAKVQELLIKAAADKKGQTPEDFLKAEVEGKAAEVAAEKVDAFYTARSAQIRAPKEQVEGQIRSFLAYQALVEGLEAEAKIERSIEPFRIDVPTTGEAKGPADAPVTIVEYGDFECPPCGMAYATLKKVRETFPDKVRIIFQQFPLRSIHPKAQKAAEASLCAADQGKFWQMHDHLFENQKNLGVEEVKTAAAAFEGLDAAAFNSCLDEGKTAERVEQELQDGTRLGVGSTPSFFVNGRPIPGLPTYEGLVELVEQEIALRSKG